MRSAIRRPVSVTIIGCIDIAIGALLLIQTISSLVRTGSMANQAVPDNLLPISLQLGISFISMIVAVVSGYFILKGMNWGRWLFILWSVVCLLMILITSQN
jgi:hypothetical protein